MSPAPELGKCTDRVESLLARHPCQEVLHAELERRFGLWSEYEAVRNSAPVKQARPSLSNAQASGSSGGSYTSSSSSR